MADKKISALTGAATPLAGTEVLPIVQSGATVKVATNDLTVRNFRANATTGILQVTGPAAASTRVATVPDANFTVARTDAAQSFTGTQTVNGILAVGSTPPAWSVTTTVDLGLGSAILNPNSTGQTWFYTNAYFNAGAKYKAAGEATWYQQVAGAHNFYGSAAGVNSGDPITFVQTGGLDNSGNMAVTGNFVVSTSGKGIDFSADPSASGMTSELLDDYEEGTWTPDQGSGLTVTGTFGSSGTYTKIGRMVFVTARITASVSMTFAGGFICSNLPFAIGASTTGSLINSDSLGNPGSTLAAPAASPSLYASAVSSPTGSITYSIAYPV